MIFRNLSVFTCLGSNVPCKALSLSIITFLPHSGPHKPLVHHMQTGITILVVHAIWTLTDSPWPLTLLDRLLSSRCLSYLSHAPHVLISSSEPPLHRDTFLTLFGLRFLLLGSSTTWMLSSIAQALLLCVRRPSYRVAFLTSLNHCSSPPYLNLSYATQRLCFLI